MNLEEIILYENEYTGVDFKATQYMKAQHEALLKDLIAMANANMSSPRYIITGVKFHPHGDREFIPIIEGEFRDEAIYQQLVRENIEPELPFRYQPIRINDQLFGVFTISSDVRPPYLMRKDFGTLRKGDGWIRVGSAQDRLSRNDLDRIYSALHAVSDSSESTSFDRIFSQASAANADGYWFSVVADYGMTSNAFGDEELLSLLDWAKSISEYDPAGTKELDVTPSDETVWFNLHENYRSEFTMRYQHPGIFCVQYRGEGTSIALNWIVHHFVKTKRYLDILPQSSGNELLQLGISLSNWPSGGIDTSHYFGCESLRKSHTGGFYSLCSVRGKSIDWNAFFQQFIGNSLKRWGYAGFQKPVSNLHVV